MATNKLSRRDFLYSAGLGAFALLGSRFIPTKGQSSSVAWLNTMQVGGQIEEFIPDAEISISAAEKYVQILTGAQTRVWSYEGQLLSAPAVAPASAKRESVAKNVALFFASPFIGLAYLLAVPFIGTYAVIKYGWKAITKST